MTESEQRLQAIKNEVVDRLSLGYSKTLREFIEDEYDFLTQEILVNEVATRFASSEVELFKEKVRELGNITEEHGVEGCTYGDTDYDSMSVAHGYNLAIEHINESILRLLDSIKP